MRRTHITVVSLFLFAGIAQGQNADPDETFLRSKGIAIDAKGLLKFFQDRTPNQDERDSLEQLVKKLGSRLFRTRDEASKKLLLRGEVSLPYLKTALKNSPLEVVRRAKLLIAEIERGTGPDIIVAAARVLALRKPDGGTKALLDYMPAVDREWVEDELLTSLGRLYQAEKQGPAVLTQALQSDVSGRKAAAVYVLGKWGDVALRDQIRPLLDHDDELVKLRAAQSLAGKTIFKTYHDARSADNALLADNKIKADFESLSGWLEDRTLSDADQNHLSKMLLQLGDRMHRKRVEAVQALLKRGSSALPFLKQMTSHPDLEISQRSKLCIQHINEGPGPVLPAAVIRALTRQALETQTKISPAVKVLIGFAPFAEDESVEDAVVSAVGLLSVQRSTIHPELLSALEDPLAGRRAVAAMVVGQVGAADHVTQIQRHLFDNSVNVRFRAVKGLLAAGDKQAVGVLIDLLTDVPKDSRWQAEDMLHQISQHTFSPDPTKFANVAARQKEWRSWWKTNRDKWNLTGLASRPAFRGLLLITEYDTNGRVGGRVWESGLDGKQRWTFGGTFGGLVGAMDAQILPNGRILVAENSGRRITERDRTGKVHWEYSVNSNPVMVQRLSNGNTMIACYNQIMEVTPAKQVVFTHRPNPTFYIYSAKKLRNGDIVCFTQRGQIIELDGKTGGIKKTISIGPSSGWGSVEPLPNGRYLVANQRTGEVKEIDGKGKQYWRCQLPGAFRATRLPNGQTAVVSMTQRAVVLFDSRGQTVRSIACQGRPWGVRYR